MTADPATAPGQCLPSDPSVSGLWWMFFSTDDGSDGEWEVWEWVEDDYKWKRGGRHGIAVRGCCYRLALH